MSLFYFALLIAFNISLVIIPTNAGSDQKKLLAKLFENYNPYERPTLEENESLRVELGLSIQQIVDIDEKKQTMISSGWLDMSWNDYNLKWNPEEFGNITSLRVSSKRIWIPDVLLYNSADDTFDPKYEVNAVINYNGEINYLPPGMFKSICQIDIYQFPFDEQFCQLKFGSWTYDELTVDLKNKSDSAQLDSYIENGEWALEKCLSYSESIKYECCPTKYPFVMFTIHIRRRTLYYIFNLVFPCVLISFMSVLGFTLPPDSGEKVGLEIITLLSIIMFSQFFMGIIPESSLSVPKIAIYFASVIVISAMSIIANVLVLILHHRNVKLQRPLPKWINKWVCNYLARLLLMKRVDRDLLYNNTNNSSNMTSSNNNHVFNNHKKKSEKIEQFYRKRSSLANGIADSNGYSYQMVNHDYGTKDILIYETKPNRFETEMSKKNQHLNMILKELQLITRKLKADEEDEQKSLDWKFAAMVIDRLCFVCFSLATFVSTVVILLTANNFFKFT